jgi:beta-glucosidase
MIYKSDFGKDFIWGTSTAAYQIEGAFNAHGKGLSIWDDFSNLKKGKSIKGKANGNIAANHYHLYPTDFELMNQLDFENYRFSTAWSRILPDGVGQINTNGLDFYDRLIDTMLGFNITPWLTLYHWDLPLALHKKGGWKNRDILSWFEEYVCLVASKFGDRVKNWMVLNEPLVFTGAGYFIGIHAPGHKGISNFIPSMLHATLCQSLGGRLIRDLLPDANIGTTFSFSHVEPIDQSDTNRKAAEKIDALLNRLYLEPLLGLGYPLKELPALKRVEKYMQPQDEANFKFDFDFIGVQNYTREVVKAAWYIPYVKARLVGAKNRNVPFTTMGWEIYPKSVYHILKKIDAYKKIKKIYITENGAAFSDVLSASLTINDQDRIKFFEEYLSQVYLAKQEGIPVEGYFVWSFLDNFEWAEGYEQRFGLIYTDYKSQKRYVKDSGYWFQSFLKGELALLPTMTVLDYMWEL